MKKQRICIVGDGLSGLMTALALNKLEGLEVHLISRKNKHSKDRRTTAISASNYEFFNKVIDKLDKKLFWPSKKIDLFYETKDQNMNFLNFNEDKKNLMYIFENDKVKESFGKLHEELELEYNEDEAGKYLKESSKYIMELKYKFQRPRPHQIADFYGIDLNGVDLDSMKTPSYPSGHATQGYLLGMIYSERYPEYRKEFMKLGEDIAESRIVGKAHFPSDKKAGIELAEKLFQNRK